MLVAVNRLLDVDHPAKVCFGVVELSFLQGDFSQLVQSRSDARMNFPVNALLYGQRLLQQIRRLAVAIFGDQRSAENRQRGRRFGMLASVKSAIDIERLPVEDLSFLVMAQLKLDGAQIDQSIRDQRVAIAIELAIHCQHSLIESF